MCAACLPKRGWRAIFSIFRVSTRPVYGELIARFLRGELGAVDKVDPYLVALLFAGDRADAAAQLRCWLDAGHAVVLDRYVYSNVGFQCAKLPAGDRQEELRRWILDLEFGYYGIPRPDVSLFLDVPFAFTEKKALRGTRRRRPRIPERGTRHP